MDTTVGDGGPGAARRPGGPSWTSHDGDAECWLATCVDLAGPDDPSDPRRRADATGTATVGGVRVLAVARSVRASSALAGGEAERAVAAALDAADRMLTATSFDVEAAAAAIPRGILNRWRSAAPEEAPGPAHGTSLLVALAGRRGVRVLRFGAGSAAVVHASGVEFLPYVPPLVAEPLDTSIWGAAGPGGAGETVHGENALAEEADEGSVLPLPLLGLDHADAVRTVATARVSSTHHPTLVVLSVEPEDGLVEAAREPWAEALRAVDARLAREGSASPAEDDAGSGPVTDTQPNSPHRELHPADHPATDPNSPHRDLDAAPEDDTRELEAVTSPTGAPAPTWLVPALPVTMGTGALAWLPADERAAVAAAPVATAAASTGTARDSGSLARWLVAGLLTLLLAGVASLAWALLTPRAETQLPTAPSTAPLSGTPTTATSAPPPASTATATPSASTSAPPSTSASAVRTTSTPTRRSTRTAAPAPTTAAPTETPAPSTSSPAPSTAEPSSTQPTATATTASPTTPSATSTETVVP